jgi:predicted SprT family Zn-dependent metalloprotease
MKIETVRFEVESLLAKHGLLEKGWRFKLANGKRLMGECIYGRNEIRISRWLITMGTDEEILDTLRHEVAHAVVGPGHHHGLKWKLVARQLGAKPEACVSEVSYTVPHKYEVLCGCCHKVVQKRHRRANMAKMHRRYHRSCGRSSIGTLYQKVAGVS